MRLLVRQPPPVFLLATRARDGHKKKRPNAKNLTVFPKSEWVVVENCHDTVKTQEEHDQIVQLIEGRKLLGKRARQQAYAFSGLIKCAICGHSHTFYTRRGEIYMKPCWYIDSVGAKCRNEGKKVVNDAYEYGDYTRTEWLKRKKKWEDEIHKTKNALYELHKQAKSTVRITNADRQKMLFAFFDNITQLTDQATRNSLYQKNPPISSSTPTTPWTGAPGATRRSRRHGGATCRCF